MQRRAPCEDGGGDQCDACTCQVAPRIIGSLLQLERGKGIPPQILSQNLQKEPTLLTPGVWTSNFQIQEMHARGFYEVESVLSPIFPKDDVLAAVFIRFLAFWLACQLFPQQLC